MRLWDAILLGFVQGVTEFLPVSSSGHLSILQNFFHTQGTEQGHFFFDVLLHLGTLISVCLAYRAEVVDVVREVIGWFRKPVSEAQKPKDPMATRRLILMVVMATLPLFIVVFYNNAVEPLYYSTVFIGIALILTGFMLYVADRMIPGRKNEKTMRVRDALIVGVCQAIAVIPGLSRSGTTITAGIATGLNREFAVKYSFLLSIPAVLGATVLTLADAIREGINFALLPTYLVGMVVAGVSGYFSISLIRRIAKKSGFGGGAYYCWIVGVVTVFISILL